MKSLIYKIIGVLLITIILFFLKSEDVSAAFSAVTGRGNAVENASDSSIAVSPSAAITVGKIAIVACLTDNEQTTNGSSTLHSLSDTDLHTWTKVYEETDSDGAANDGSTTSLWWTKVTSEIGTSDSITCTLGAAKTDKILQVFEVTVGTGNSVATSVGTPTHSDSGTDTILDAAISSLTSKEYLFVGNFGSEGEDNVKDPDADYTELFDLYSSTSGVLASNLESQVQYRIYTGIGDTCTAGANNTVTFTNATHTLAAFYEVSGVTISGTIYQTSNESLAYDCSSGGPYTVRLRVNGLGSYSDDCDQNTGAWEVTGVSVSSGQTIYAYIYGEGINGSTVLVSDGTQQIDVPIYQNRVALRDDVNASITNSEISAGDTGDSDDLISFSGSDLQVASTYETHIYTSDTFAPGANVSTGRLHVVGNYTAGTYTLTLTATSGTLLTRTGTFTQDTSTVSVTSSSGPVQLLSTATTLYNLQISAGSSSVVVNAGATPTFASSGALTINTGVINFDTGVAGPGNSTLTIGASGTMCLGGTAAATNTSTTCNTGATSTTAIIMPSFSTYTFDASSTVIYLSDADLTGGNVISRLGGSNYGNLYLYPTLVSTNRTYTLETGTFGINGNFTINPKESGAVTPSLTVNMAGTTTVAAGKTTTIQASDSAASSLDLNPGTSYDLSTGLLNIAAGGTLDGTSATSTITLTGISGTLLTKTGALTAGNTTVSVTSTSGSPTFNSGIFTGSDSLYNLTINPSSITITTSADDITVTGTLNIASNDTLSLFSGQDLTHSGATLILDGTISGAGTLIYQSATAFPTTGAISSVLRMDATNNDQTMAGTPGGRTFGGNVELYNNSSSNPRTITLGTAGSQTLTFSGNLTVNAANTQGITVTGVSNSPIVNVSGNFSGTSGGSTETVTTGGGTWTITGNVNLTGSTLTASTNNTIKMDGNSKTITSASNSLYNFESAGTISNADSLAVNNNISVSSGTFTQSNSTTVTNNISVSGGAAYDVNAGLSISGGSFTTAGTSATISATSGSPTVTISGTGNIGGGTNPSINLYDLTTSGSGTTSIVSTVTTAGDVSVGTGTTLDIKADLNINGGALTTAGTATVTTTSGTPTVNITGTGTVGGGTNTMTFYSLTVDGVSTATPNSPISINNKLTVGDGTNAATFQDNTNDKAVSALDLEIKGSGIYSASSDTTYPLTVSRDFTNNGTFNANAGKIVFNTTNTSTLTYSGATTFAQFTVNTPQKTVRFSSSSQTNITDTLILQGTDCTTNRVFIDSDNGTSSWSINATGVTKTVEFVNVKNSNAVAAISADNSTDGGGNTGLWTINSGVCSGGGAIETKLKSGVKIKGGVQIK